MVKKEFSIAFVLVFFLTLFMNGALAQSVSAISLATVSEVSSVVSVINPDTNEIVEVSPGYAPVPLNAVPSIDSFSPVRRTITLDVGERQEFGVEVSDADNDKLTIAWYFDGNLVASSSSYTLDTSKLLAGSYDLNVVVSDGDLTTKRYWKINVPTFISIVLVQCPAGGSLNFGKQSAGSTAVPMQCQNDLNGAIKVIVEDSTNTIVDLNISGTDYIGPNGYVIPVQNTRLGTSNNASVPAPITLTKMPQTIFTNLGGKKLAEKQLWVWIDLPDGWLPAGEYRATYTFNAYPVGK
jgi:hypothetical protein